MDELMKPEAAPEKVKPTFKYHVIAETYRDQRRMAVGEEWFTTEDIHDSVALFPADKATEDAYLKKYARVVNKIPVRDAIGVIGFKEEVRYGRHVARLMEKRKVQKEDWDAYLEVEIGAAVDVKMADSGAAKALADVKAELAEAKAELSRIKGESKPKAKA